MSLESEIKVRGTQAVINDNEQFDAWIMDTLSLGDVLTRCPGIISEIMEEFNNDWIEAVEAAAEEAGIDRNTELLRALLTDVHDEYGIECSERDGTLAIYKAGTLYSVEYTADDPDETEIRILDFAAALEAMIDLCDTPARWYHVRYGADS